MESLVKVTNVPIPGVFDDDVYSSACRYKMLDPTNKQKKEETKLGPLTDSFAKSSKSIR
jgi:hypothetical protein